MMQSLKPESTDVANTSIDNKTKNFSTLSKRIQRDRQHYNDGHFENHIKKDAKENKIATLYAGFKRFLRNFKAHLYKEYSLDGNTKENITTNSLFQSKYYFFNLRKRRKKKSSTDCLENKQAAITLDCPDINIERKINYIDICNSEYGANTNELSKDFYNKSFHSDKAIINWNKLEDENNRTDKTTLKYNGHRNTDLTCNITYYTGLAVDPHENKKDLDKNRICNKEYYKQSIFNTSLCSLFHNFTHYFGSINKMVSNYSHRHETYMVMNVAKCDFKSDYYTNPGIRSGINAKLKEIEDLRNYTLTSYLAEYDWKENQLGSRNRLETDLKRLLSISKCEISIQCVVRFYIHLTRYCI